MRRASVSVLVLALFVGVWAVGDLRAVPEVKGDGHTIQIVDNCLPGDPGWNPTGGCALKPEQGDVSFAEFNLLLRSPLTIPPNGVLVGHPSWRNEPSYLSVKEQNSVHVENTGGRTHTFTEVADFGGGFVPPLNIGLAPAPECDPSLAVPLPAGASDRITGLAPGLHKFQCCIHPWMRAAIRVN